MPWLKPIDPAAVARMRALLAADTELAAPALDSPPRVSRFQKRHVVVVGCSGAKLPHRAKARDLYTSTLFRKCRAYAERFGDEWVIISALHGVIDPDREIDPYDREVRKLRRAQRIDWAKGVRVGMLHRYTEPHVEHGVRFTVLAGEDYCGWIEAWSDPMYDTHTRFDADCPMKGMQIGQRLAWLTNALKEE